MLKHLSDAPQKPERVILLGASGFIGQALLPLLENDQIPVVQLSTKELDLTKEDSSEKLAGQLKANDQVVFLSCLTPDRGRDATTMIKNIQMADNVGKAIAKTPVAQLIYMSSDAVYDLSVSPCDEQRPTFAPDLYGNGHIAREVVLTTACSQAKVPLCVLRPVAQYGVGDTHNSYGPNRFIRQAKKEGVITLFGQGEETREHIHVKDVADITKLCLQHKSEGILNIASGKSLSFHDVATAVMANIKGKDVTLDCKPRSNEITHKHFNNAELIKCFPTFKFRDLNESLKAEIDLY